MKALNTKAISLGAGIFFITGLAVHGATTLYNNSTTDTGNSLNFSNGWTMGNEIHLNPGVSSAIITSFSYEIYSTSATFAGGANVKMEAFLYANNGSPFHGYASPGNSPLDPSALYVSGLFTLLTPQQSLGAGKFTETLNFDLSGSPVAVGNDFTLVVGVIGLTGADSVGMELFDPATVGQNFGDYWLNTGVGWGLFTNSVRTDFGAQIFGTAIPEPSARFLAGAGATLLTGLIWLRRRQDQIKQD
jgi:hypothetical protein